MKCKKNVLCLIVIIIVVTIIGGGGVAVAAFNGWVFFDTPTEICDGFSPALIHTLNTKYQISIPENANFIKGINTNSFRDPMVVILFECAIDDLVPAKCDGGYGYSYVFQALNLNESTYEFGGVDEEVKADWYNDFGGTLDYIIKCKDDPHTFISYSIINDTLTVRFIGRHPGAAFN